MNAQQEELQQNARHLIIELMDVCRVLPNSKNRDGLEKVIVMFKKNLALISILTYIQSNITATADTAYADATNREKDKSFWEYILKVVVGHIPSAQKNS
jgi:hypothetical protein